MNIYANIPSSSVPQFVQGLKDTCAALGIAHWQWLLAIMYMESGVNPAIVNKNGGATGLIQFIPSTAKGLGTSVEALKKMSAVQQLVWVKKYFQGNFKSLKITSIKSFADLYMVVFYPKAYGKADSYVIGIKGQKAYDYNRAIDTTWGNNDGVLTAGDFRMYANTKYQKLQDLLTGTKTTPKSTSKPSQSNSTPAVNKPTTEPASTFPTNAVLGTLAIVAIGGYAVMEYKKKKSTTAPTFQNAA